MDKMSSVVLVRFLTILSFEFYLNPLQQLSFWRGSQLLQLALFTRKCFEQQTVCLSIQEERYCVITLATFGVLPMVKSANLPMVLTLVRHYVQEIKATYRLLKRNV